MTAAMMASDHAFANGPVFPAAMNAKEAEKAFAAYADARQAAEQFARLAQQFRGGAELGEGVRLGLGARLINLVSRDHVQIAGPCAIRGILRNEAKGRLSIAPYVYIGDNVLVSCFQSVEIGEATLLAHGVQVFDNNTHPTNAFQREIQFRRMLGDKSQAAPLEIASAPITIGKRCWIGFGAAVMRGVTIGDNTIVSAGSVVSKSLPAGVIASGNPATVVRELTRDELGLTEKA